MSNNPFTLSFGKEPKECIKRIQEYDEITMDFESDNPKSSVYILTGLRGTGKTVLLTSLYNYFDNNDDFVAVDLNTRSNMLEDLASSIYDKGKIKYKFLEKQFSFSFRGLTISLSGKNPVSSISVLLEKMLTILKEKGKKLVITVDDIDTGNNMKIFVKEFQSLFRKNMPIYIIATGLYDVVDNLERQEGLTFLQRSQKRYLSPLNIRYIAASYKTIFEIDHSLAIKLAELTKGYAFAFQTVGYLFYESKTKVIDDKFLAEYDYYLEEYVYKRVYEEISQREKKILEYIVINKKYSNKELVEAGVVSNNEISLLKDKLYKRGIIDKKERGMFNIILPRFEEYLYYEFNLYNLDDDNLFE